MDKLILNYLKYQKLNEYLTKYKIAKIPKNLNFLSKNLNHGNLTKWLDLLAKLPDLKTESYNLNSKQIEIKLQNNLTIEQNITIKNTFQQLKPWRKGPFSINNLFLDAEWDSSQKWLRLASKIDLHNKTILDIGSNNGYYSFKMLAQKPRLVLGIEPYLLYVIQFLLFHKYIDQLVIDKIFTLPITLEEFVNNYNNLKFDVTFSMGVLYHRRSPIDHLLNIKKTLIKGGKIILETLIIEGDSGYYLMPENNYAGIPNVWFIPTILTLKSWLKKCGFSNIQIINVSQTSSDEQRTSNYSNNKSLSNYLVNNKTIEGYHCPIRAILFADNK